MASSESGRVARGLLSLVVLAALIVGIPVGLMIVAGSPIPTSLPSWDHVVSTLTHPDVTGSFLLGVLKVVGWIAWISFAIPAVTELISVARGVRPPRLRGFGLQQRVAAVLVGAVLALFAAGPATGTPALQPAATVSVSATESVAGPVATPTPGGAPVASGDTAQSATVPRVNDLGVDLPTYIVHPGDTLWAVAEKTTGDGTRFQEIAELNYGVLQADGTALDSSHWLEPGWVLHLPADVATRGASPDQNATDSPSGTSLLERSEPEAQALATHVVQPGESLSSIARDELGDEGRYSELWEVNQGVAQSDGRTLTDPDLIQPGWNIAVPGAQVAEAPSPEAPAPQTPVSPDTEESAPQADPAPASPEASPRSTPKHRGGGPAVATTPETAESSARAAAPSDEADAYQMASDDALDLRTSSGVGGILAAGIVGLIAAGRIRTRRSRQPGQRAAVPEPGTAAASFETAVRAVADPMGRETVDRALRALAAHARDAGRELPPLRAARYVPGRSVELFLDAPADLPMPWAASRDRTTWLLDAAAAAHLPEASVRASAPYPSLVTVGQDAEAHIMLDLERVGCLDVRGTMSDGQAVLAALAIELGTSPWADDLQVTVVGTLAELPGIVDTGRIRHVVSLGAVMQELEARALDVDAALRQVRVATIAEARSAGLFTDSWTPEILLVGEQLGPMVRAALERLVARVPGVGVAAVTTGADVSQWALEVDPRDPDRGVLYPAGVQLLPQRLDMTEYPQALSLLRFSENVPGLSWARNLVGLKEPQLAEIFAPASVEPDDATRAATNDATRSGRSDATQGALSDMTRSTPDDATTPRRGAGAPSDNSITTYPGRSVSPLAVGAGPADVTVDPFGVGPLGLGDDASQETAVRPLAPVRPTSPAPQPTDQTLPRASADVTDDAPAANTSAQAIPIATTETAPVRSLRTPIVRILGPVVVEVSSGITMPASHQRQATELLAYLAFHPGATGADISAALWPTRDPNLATRRSAVSRARRWLGVGADGHEYLPRYWVRDDGTPADQESAGYRLRGVHTDWDEFVRLVGPDAAQTPTKQLTEALALVRGPVFADVPPRKYVWAESLWQEITAGIVDVAHEVARRSLLAGDTAGAREAARVGRLVDPADERGWRDGIRAEWADGRVRSVTRLVAQLRDHLSSLDLDAEPETEDLISEVEASISRRGSRRWPA